MDNIPSHDVIVADYWESLLTRYVGLASFTILLWDHIITFGDELEYVWKGRKGLRSLQMIGLSVVALMMFVRVRALYPRVLAVQAVVLAILCTYLGLNSWLLTRGVPVQHPAYPLVDLLIGLSACTMIMDPRVGPIASSSAWLPLLYDTVVIALTLRRTASFVTAKNPSRLFVVMLQEGLLYYSHSEISVICVITLVLTVMIIGAPPGVRNITAQLELCLTVAMMSRITIHLRSFASRSDSVMYSEMTLWGFNRPRQQVNSAMVFAAKDRKGRKPSETMFSLGHDGLSTVPEDEPSFLMKTFSGTVTTTAAGTGSSSTQHASEFDAPVDGPRSLRSTDPGELHEMYVMGSEGPGGVGRV
ncbi:hypothetical protein BJV78DRAFT_1154306 [Lactifluus subvellereus]|nr:hypothetical protein BJV78DRAFT_1154306 [Lactifluus subvellereus]